MKKCQPRLLTPYIDGELSTDQRGEMEEHLRSCPSCGAMLDEVTLASEHVRQMGRATIPLSALEPAVDAFAERAGLELGAPALRDTVEVAREPVPAMAVGAAPAEAPVPQDIVEPPAVAEPPGMVVSEPMVLEEPMVPEEPVVPEAIVPIPFEPAGVTVPPAPPRPTTADSPGIGLADEPLITKVEPIENAAPEPMALDPGPMPYEAQPRPQDDLGQMEMTAPTEPGEDALDLHAEALPQELRPPWLSQDDVEDQGLEAEGRAAVDDAIEREEANAGIPEGPEDTGAPGATDDEPEGAFAESDVTEAAAEDLPISPIAPIPDLVPSRPEPRLEPPPEPWSTVWRSPREAEPAHETAAAEAFSAASDIVEPDLEPEPVAEAEAPAAEPEAPIIEPSRAGFENGGAGGTAGDKPLPEVEEALARLRGDLREGVVEPAALEESEEFESLADYREALRTRREPRKRVLGGLDLSLPATQVKVGAAAAVLLLLIVAGIAVVMAATRSQPNSASAAATQPKPASSAPQSQASAAPSAAASPATTAKVPQLTGAVTAGAGGSGYKVSTIRTGSPGNGITRLVLDLEGTGPTPSVQLGHGPDGADYLVASGLSIDPALINGFKGSGAITGISQVSPDGTSLKLTVTGSPQYAIVYLNSPSRLVIDFK